MKQSCFKCNKYAVWCYMPGTHNVSNYYCDAHVPRGCSCSLDENNLNSLDEQGRLYPCCEYDYDINGYNLD